MTQEQIKKYEYCKRHLAEISAMVEKSPFKHQMHGCGSQSAKITFELEEIHVEMYNSIQKAIETAKLKISEKIENL